MNSADFKNRAHKAGKEKGVLRNYRVGHGNEFDQGTKYEYIKFSNKKEEKTSICTFMFHGSINRRSGSKVCLERGHLQIV